MQLRHDIRSLSQNFQILADYQSAEPYGTGHINDTYAATYRQGGTTIRYIHQRINQNIFKDAVGLMENVQRVTDHLRAKLAGRPDVTRRGAHACTGLRRAAVLHRSPGRMLADLRLH